MRDSHRLDGPYTVLTKPVRDAIVAKGVLRRYRRGEIIIREGAYSDEFFIIVSGTVETYSRDESEREFIYSRHGAGGAFGDVSLDGGLRPSSIRAVTATTCAVVTHRTLLEHCIENPDCTAELIRILSARIRRLTIIARALALNSVDHRIGELLERLAVDVRGVRMIPDRLTHQQIAGYVGASREMVSKVLKEMSANGLLERQDRHIVLLKPFTKRR